MGKLKNRSQFLTNRGKPGKKNWKILKNLAGFLNKFARAKKFQRGVHMKKIDFWKFFLIDLEKTRKNFEMVDQFLVKKMKKFVNFFLYKLPIKFLEEKIILIWFLENAEIEKMKKSINLTTQTMKKISNF